MTDEVTQAAPVEAAVTESTTPAQPRWSPEVEEEARALGWKAEDEWKGEKPAGYIPEPDRYLERAENFGPFRKLKEANAETLRRLEAVTAKQLERERAQHQAELAIIKAQKVAAVEVGDVDAYKALEKREDALAKQMQPEQPTDAVPPDHKAAIEQWMVNRPWFKQDKLKTNAASLLYGEAQQSGLTDPKAILAYVDREMGKQFVDLAPKAAPVEAVEGGLTFGAGSVASPFEKLPKDAKETFRRYVERGIVQDTKEARATWAEDYNAA